jgi:hypothetical protein
MRRCIEGGVSPYVTASAVKQSSFHTLRQGWIASLRSQ